MSDIAGDAQYDAATAIWGGDWRMPTNAELKELFDNCTWTWTTQNGVNGYKVTGPSGASIFLPAAGYRDGSSLEVDGGVGKYWSSTPYEKLPNCANILSFNRFEPEMSFNYRNYGYSVRPVID